MLCLVLGLVLGGQWYFSRLSDIEVRLEQWVVYLVLYRGFVAFW